MATTQLAADPAAGGLLGGQMGNPNGITRQQLMEYMRLNPAMAGDANNPLGNLFNQNQEGMTDPKLPQFYDVPGLGKVQYDPSNGQVYGAGSGGFAGGNTGIGAIGQNNLTRFDGTNMTPTNASFDRQHSALESAAPYIIGAGGLAIGAGAAGLLGGANALSGIGAAAGGGGGADALAASVGALEGGGGAAAGAGAAGAGAIPQMIVTGAAPTAGLTAGQIAALGVGGAGAAATLGSSGSVGGLDANGLGPNPGSNLSQINGAVPGGTGLLSGIDPSILKAGAGVLGGLLGGVSGTNSPSSTTSTTQNAIDPRMGNILYGADGKSGVLNTLAAQGAVPQNPALAAAGTAASNYAGANTTTDLNAQREAAARLMAGNTTAPTMQAAQAAQTPAMQAAQVAQTPAMQAAQINSPNAIQAALAQASTVNAPAQNNVDLTSSYQKFINGNSAEDPYLTGAIGKGINQSTNAFQAQQQASTDNLMKNILPSIRSNSILSGQFGGSRQGIAEGNAIGDFTKAQQQALSQFGQNNTDAAVSAQSGAYNAGQDRSLSATTGLGAQQYGVAQQNSAQAQQAALANAQAQNQVALANQQLQTGVDTNNAQLQQQAGQTNYGGLLSGNLADAGYKQSAATTNYTGTQGVNLANAGFSQGAGTSNLQSQLTTNGLNSGNTMAGINATGGLLSGAYGTGQINDAYDINKTGKVAGLLGPYVNANATQTSTNPLYQNTAGNVIGGITAGLGLYNAFK